MERYLRACGFERINRPLESGDEVYLCRWSSRERVPSVWIAVGYPRTIHQFKSANRQWVQLAEAHHTNPLAAEARVACVLKQFRKDTLVRFEYL